MAPPEIPAGAAPEGDGIAVGSGPVRVDAYIDLLCPYCRAFEQRAGATLDALVAEGRATIVYHPVAFLDRFSEGTEYSTRAAAALGAAAQAGAFPAYKDALFAQQPEENTPGLSDEQLTRIGAESGIADPSFADDLLGGRFRPWVELVTEAAVERGVNGIPTVFVAGRQVDADADPIAAAVAAAGG
ncbi:thioredoxin domain-containing protein [Conexibacter sp. JD483]|uniref:DsbA family protein n=1 Tax=unclassified Conexibacter TaxID=2627773 RepID=UPI00271EA2E1|nr:MULTISPECIES: thioredoxin domain-containing protein [unclassified Conexibacter]MDO8186587.1 thioredoxin domain-containing protein [Conexibacter sp. CPCC 205706]MDO8196692.1 thioredoxin domain-containing protein [Conexibacter sp. CPCC 205762]MDR9372654.1 thioredoxin domain-containing protein [Conexibacter sp. JD483]